MPGHDLPVAAARRDEGIRRVRRLTWQAAVASVLGSAVIAVTFGHHAEARTARPAAPPGSIVVPGQPPAAVPGAGHVTSGGS
jgi:hypothetical protein